IGVHARDWVTWHGFALNVTNDLSYFDLIVPCGIEGVVMTSMRRESPVPVLMDDVREAVAAAFTEVFEFTGTGGSAGLKWENGAGRGTGYAVTPSPLTPVPAASPPASGP
ncbi:MAG TPA: hypothetical protein VF041_07750, partial [Gemmatimonadaceae bacterium]